MNSEKNDEKIDIIIPWVDGNDEAWIEKKDYWLARAETIQKVQSTSNRYRNGVDLKYVFRSIEKNIPWINRIFLVTDSQIPDFLDLNHPKLSIIYHRDYIPPKYLPTFNSNTIEMNYFRIDELSEKFILFNDDIFLLEYIPKDYFFIDGLPCDMAIETIIAPKENEGIVDSFSYTQHNNMAVINKHFCKKEIQEKYHEKWFSAVYEEEVEKTKIMSYFTFFSCLKRSHMPQPFLKSKFRKVWEQEKDLLDTASCNKFRNYSDVSHYLVRFWNICDGDFIPRKEKGTFFSLQDDNIQEIVNTIRNRDKMIVCINDSVKIKNFDDAIIVINRALDTVFPDKCSFEK